jgi:hypothetical protein
MGVRSKIPVAGEGGRQGAEGEASRSDPQDRGRALEAAILIDLRKECFSKRPSRNLPPCLLRQVSALRSRSFAAVGWLVS